MVLVTYVVSHIHTVKKAKNLSKKKPLSATHDDSLYLPRLQVPNLTKMFLP